MSSTNAPFGMSPVHHASGIAVRMSELNDGITSGYNTAIYQDQPVKLVNGVLQPVSSTSDEFIGTFVGCIFTPPGGLRPVFSNFWPANATYVAGTCKVFYYSDPAIVYAIQADGSVAQTAIGDQANFTNLTAFNAASYISQTTMSSSLVGSGSQGQVRVLDLYLGPDNAWGDSYTTVLVQISKHQFVANKNAI